MITLGPYRRISSFTALPAVLAACLLLGRALFAEHPIAREDIRAVEKEAVKQAAQIDADSTKAIDALRGKDSIKDIHTGTDAAFAVWKKSARQFTQSPKQTSLGKKLSSLQKDAASGGDIWKEAEATLQTEWDDAINDLTRELESKTKAIEDAFGLVNDAGQRIARPAAAREQLVNQACNGLQAAFDNATRRLASRHLDVLRDATERLEREIKADEDRKQAERLATERARAEAEETKQQQLAEEQEAQEQERRQRHATPSWDGFENLNEILSRFCKDGDEPHDDEFDPPDEDTADFGIPPEGYEKLRLFVPYGTVENAKKAIAGDRFDKEEVAATASEHRERVRKAKFYIPCKYIWHEGADTGSDEIRLFVDMPCRCVVPRSSSVSACDVFTGWWWCLDEKKGSLKKCFNVRDASQKKKSGQQLYVPEDIYKTRLFVTVKASRDVLKLIARNPEGCTLNVGVSGLRMERPNSVGFFRLSLLENNGDSTDAIRRGFASGLNGPKDTPNYFVTQVAGKDPEDGPPEVVVCDLERLEIVQATPDKRSVLCEWVPEAGADAASPLISSLLGHWVTEGGETHRYFDTDTVVMVEKNRSRPQSYKVVDSSDKESRMTIQCSSNGGRYSLPGARPVLYDLTFSPDRKSIDVVTYLQKVEEGVRGKWIFVDATRQASRSGLNNSNGEGPSKAVASTQLVERLQQRPAPSDDPADDPGRIVEALQRTMRAKNLRPDTELGRMLDAYRGGVPTWTKEDGTAQSIDTLGLPAINWAKKTAVPAWAGKDSGKTPFVGVVKEEHGTRFTLAPTRIMEDLRCTISFLVIDVNPAHASARELDYLAAQIELYGGDELELETSPAIHGDTLFDIWSSTKNERYTVTRWGPNRPMGHMAPAYGPLLFGTLENEPDFVLLENLKIELSDSFRAGCRELCEKVRKQREANGLRHLPMCVMPASSD